MITEFQFYRMKRLAETDGDDNFTIMKMHLMALNYTVKMAKIGLGVQINGSACLVCVRPWV
jgi:hypothetical protein